MCSTLLRRIQGSHAQTRRWTCVWRRVLWNTCGTSLCCLWMLAMLAARLSWICNPACVFRSFIVPSKTVRSPRTRIRVATGTWRTCSRSICSRSIVTRNFPCCLTTRGLCTRTTIRCNTAGIMISRRLRTRLSNHVALSGSLRGRRTSRLDLEVDDPRRRTVELCGVPWT